MRGKGFAGRDPFFNNGITPAYAGKSFGNRPAVGCGKDHPRLCGEKISFRTKAIRSQGSPPPMRGKGGAVCDPFLNHGITPAYAGKSLPIRTVLFWTEDHPRLCGEKFFHVVAASR